MAGWVLASALTLVALTLMVISGANDGGVLIAMPVRYAIRPALWFVATLAGILVVGPLLLGVSVARTLATGLFAAAEHDGMTAFLVGVVVALVVVLLLSRAGLPTSLTLALIGGLAGAALGAGLSVSWSEVARVLIIGALAPVAGVAVGWMLDRLARLVPGWQGTSCALRGVHMVAFAVQCVAYSVNDGQKMVAVAAIAMQALPGSIRLLDDDHGWQLAGVLAVSAVLFTVGLLWTVRRVTVRIGFDLASVRPVDAVSAELAGAGVVLASSAVGAPVSMTQSLAAGVVGVTASKGARRVRWDSAVRIAAAWLVTLPASGGAAFLAGLIAR